jgi:hypothetical protein
MQENDTLRSRAYNLLVRWYVVDFLRPEEMDDSSGKRMNVGRRNRSSTVIHSWRMLLSFTQGMSEPAYGETILVLVVGVQRGTW